MPMGQENDGDTVTNPVTISLCLIVRDEAELLPQFLQHASGLWDDLCVVDTGSRDATREILAAAGARIIERAWDDDFSAALQVAQREFDANAPDVIVGSSRGGAVAMNMDAGNTPLVLMCPAWRKFGAMQTVRQGSVILHSRLDHVVPFANSEELVRNSGLPASALIEVGSDHRLADPDSLRAMLHACETRLL